MKTAAKRLLLLILMVSLAGCGGKGTKESHNGTEIKQNKEQERHVVESAKVMSDHVLTNSYHLERTVQGVTDAYAVPGFWLDSTKEADRLLMTEEEIAAYNRRITHNKACKVVDLTGLEKEIDAQKVTGLIEAYGFGGNEYLDGNVLTEKKKQALMEKRNLEALSHMKKIKVTYGLAVHAADVRGFPTDEALMQSSDDWEFDYFQESKLKIGEGVCIYHATAKGDWLFVQAQNYAGWVKSSDIARCSRRQMTKYLAAKSFIIVTEPTDVEFQDQKIHFSMGCRLQKYVGKNALLPVSKNGKLELVPFSLDRLPHNEGYLPYTKAIVLDQAMKLLNTGYGWGGKNDLLDCSATMLSVYDCFGFSLPRNTSDMVKCRETKIDVSELGEEDKLERLRSVLPGSLLLMKGHVMMYLGIKDDVAYALHAFTKYYDDEGCGENVMQCTITPLTIKKASGRSYLDSVHTILEILPDAKEQ